MTINHQQYEISYDLGRIDFAQVHAWLASSYWSPGVERDRVERAAKHSSLVVGAYGGGLQVGYMRVISDRTTFGYIADVFVDELHRRRGLASAMVRFAMDHEEHRGLRRWMLITADAQDVYRQCGFGPFPKPERLMTFPPSR